MIKSTPLAIIAGLVAVGGISAVGIGIAPHATAQPTPCDMLGNPLTTAIAMLETPPYGIEQPWVVRVPCSDVGSDCQVSNGTPLQRVSPAGQGQQPQCLSNYTAGAGMAGTPPFGPQGPGPYGPYGPGY